MTSEQKNIQQINQKLVAIELEECQNTKEYVKNEPKTAANQLSHQFGPKLKVQEISKVSAEQNVIFDSLQQINQGNHKTQNQKRIVSIVNQHQSFSEEFSSQSNKHTTTQADQQKLASQQPVFHFSKNCNQNKINVYENSYQNSYDENLQQDMPDYNLCLKKTQVKEILRSKMVDWMIEVFCNYPHTTSDYTYFRAISLMDLYFKKSTKMIKDQDVHLIGMTCMFISTKNEDIHHISLIDMVEKVGHNKFNKNQIKQQEQEILTALMFQVNFPTHYDFMRRFLQKCFGFDDSQLSQNISETAIYILKMCMHDYQMLKYQPNILSLSSIFCAQNCYFDALEQECTNQNNLQIILQQKVKIVTRIQEIQFSSGIANIDECQKKVKQLTEEFETKFHDLQNLKRFNC